MKNKLIKAKHIFFTKEFGMFIVIGVINTLNGMVFPAILSFFLQVNLAYILSYIPSLGIAYLLNCKFTFSKKPELRSLVRFYISYIPNFVIQNVIFALCVNILHLNKGIGIILASIIGVPVTFVLLRFYAFRPNAFTRSKEISIKEIVQ